MLSLKERSGVTQNRKNEDEALKEMATDRRQFLRNAVRFGFGGAAALLLTSTSRQTVAESLTLNARELEAVRRSQQAQGALPDDEPSEAGPEQAHEIGIGCMGTCEGTCSRGCGGTCSTACGGTCSRGCQGTCSRDCGGSCSRGCQGTCSRDCGGTCSRGCKGTCSRGCGGTGTAGYNGH